jgi:hypothetical protein
MKLAALEAHVGRFSRRALSIPEWIAAASRIDEPK